MIAIAQSFRIIIIILMALACEQTPTDPVGNEPGDPAKPPSTDPVEPSPSLSRYVPLGVGGGGAMSGISISPYNDLWFVGTDMGTLLRSIDQGQTWKPVSHFEAVFDSRLERSVSVGFSSNGQTVYHASAGVDPVVSHDTGITFNSIPMPLNSNEIIKYWIDNSYEQDHIYAGTNQGLLFSPDKGQTWQRLNTSLAAKGTYLDHQADKMVLYHANEQGIYKSENNGKDFTLFHSPSSNLKIRHFTGGRDQDGLTLAFADDNGNEACSWAAEYLNNWGSTAINNTYNTCGYVWIKKNILSFRQTTQAVGDHLKMAENDSQTIYTTGGKQWIRQYGTKVHLSEDAGQTWSLKLHQLNWDVTPFEPWPSSKIEYSAVAIDVGWWDDGYESFAINKRNSSQVAGTGYFFLHASLDKGNYWQAPFTEYSDKGTAQSNKKWKTQGIEVISVYKLKHHPRNKNLLYAATADIGGMISDNNGESFRVSKAQYNSNYDYAFEPNNDQIVYAASGNSHDYPVDWHAQSIESDGGIYKSFDRGLNWQRLTPNNDTWNRQFLSVAFDHHNNILYGGTHSIGIARSTDGGQSWQWFNDGLPTGDKIIPQITIDPDNGNAYALLTGDYDKWTNRKYTGIYFLDVENNSQSWQLLRENVHYPPEADSGYKVWWYPTRFAVDFSDPSRNTLWLIDYENNKNWLMTGVWKSNDRGKNWHRKMQFTHPTGITIDQQNPDIVFVSGFYDLSGNWGNGGQLYTLDGGETWQKNLEPTLQHNAFSAVVDPTNSDNIFYSYFGGGILKGPNPAKQQINRLPAGQSF